MLKMKFLSKALFFIFVCMNLYACPLEEPSENNSDFAPESVAMKEFTFYKGNDGQWSFKTFFGKEVMIIVSSSAFVVDNCYADYGKTGKNQASFECWFNAHTMLGGNEIYARSEYQLQLTFLSAHHGKFTGKNMKGGQVTGMFVYDSDKDLSYFTPLSGNDDNKNDDDDDSGSKDDEDNKKEYFNMGNPTIKDLGTTMAIIKSNVTVENMKIEKRGVCYSTENMPTIYDLCVTQNINVADVTLPGLTPSTTYYARSFVQMNGKVQYSSQISFTTNDLYIETLHVYSNEILFKLDYADPNMYKGYGYTKVKAGLCYGKIPHPTIDIDDVAGMREIDPDEDTVERIEMEPGTKYYLRPYSIENDRVTYYEETEIITVGSDLILKIEHEKGKPYVTCDVDVNGGGPYEVELKIENVNHQGPYSQTVYDFGKMDAESNSKAFNYDVKYVKLLNSTFGYIQIVATDVNTKYKYFSNKFYSKHLK